MTKKHILILCIATAFVFAGISAAITYFATQLRHQDDIYVAEEKYSRLLEFFEIDSVTELITKSYYKEVDTDALVEGSLKGLMENLDDGYSRFYDERYFQYFDENTEGSYITQGMLVDKDNETGYIIVKRVFPETPAYEQHIVAGNLITSIDGMNTKSMDAECAVSCLRGKNGVEVNLDILAGDTPISISFTRKATDDQVVFCDMLGDRIGYIDYVEFSGSSVDDFKKALNTMEKENARAIILDLRGTPGGYISQASAAADLILESGTIYTTKGKDNAVFSITAKEGAKTALPIVLLVNHETKGVAEVFAAALQENNAATVVGEQTYGKGVVMSTLQVPNSGDGIRMVTAFYYSPKGNALNGKGVTPDVFAASGEEINDNASDPQLQKAIQILEEQLS